MGDCLLVPETRELRHSVTSQEQSPALGTQEAQLVLKAERAPLCLQHPPESQDVVQYECLAVLAQAVGSLALWGWCSFLILFPGLDALHAEIWTRG